MRVQDDEMSNNDSDDLIDGESYNETSMMAVTAFVNSAVKMW